MPLPLLVRRLVAVTLVALLVWLPAMHRASAQGGAVGQRKDAKAHFERGMAHYDRGEYDSAIAEFQSAYALSNQAGLLFNMAQAYRLKNDPANALDHYRRFLERVPKAPNRKDVERRIAQMEAALKSQKAAAPPAVAPPPLSPAPPEPVEPARTAKPDSPAPPALTPPPLAPAPRAADQKSSPPAAGGAASPTSGSDATSSGASARAGYELKVAGGVSIATGVAVLGAGIYFGLKSRSALNDLSTLNDNHGQWSSSYQTLYNDGQSSATRATAMYAAGGAAIGLGAVLLIIGWRQGTSAPRVAVSAGAHQASTVVTWSY